MAREPEPELYQARVWRRLQCPGTTYTPRTGHTCVVWRHYVYVFGGTDKRRRQQVRHREMCAAGDLSRERKPRPS